MKDPPPLSCGSWKKVIFSTNQRGGGWYNFLRFFKRWLFSTNHKELVRYTYYLPSVPALWNDVVNLIRINYQSLETYYFKAISII